MFVQHGFVQNLLPLFPHLSWLGICWLSVTKKPNPSQLMHKANLLAHILEECRKADPGEFLTAKIDH